MANKIAKNSVKIQLLKNLSFGPKNKKLNKIFEKFFQGIEYIHRFSLNRKRFLKRFNLKT